MFLLVASYYFYMNWKPVYALLILTSTVITFACSKFIGIQENSEVRGRKKKWILAASLIINFGILFVFKYFNFVNESVFAVLDSMGLRWQLPNLDVLLPVGISFYTFQAVGYTIDVYRGDLKAENDFFTYALFVSFFPQLVAGPIERAKNLLPQFHEHHTFSYDATVSGLKLMLWGYFMKLCVADRIGNYVDAVYNNLPHHSGVSVLLATIFFAFQIYCDFGGYSLIAIGAAKVMGFRLMENFRRPYFSLSPKEFWKRWHISLSSWFMDYVYIPLGGNRVKYWRHLTNLMITFLVSGLWHGANWTFVLWGATHGLFLVIENVLTRLFGKHEYNSLWIRLPKMLLCFALVCFAWIFFRANTASDAFMAIGKIFTEGGPLFVNDAMTVIVLGSLSLLVLVIKDLLDEIKSPILFVNSKKPIVSLVSSVLLLYYILLFGVFDGGQFIYFQF
jgi:D-alanyl-lipoteichoic acid acyltransferase DltB (MBOAT superfamily)